MKTKKIDDPAFRDAFLKTFTERDNPRRFEIHFTDLIICLCCSFMHKVMPEENSDERYDAILTWTRGLAFDWTITSRISGKTSVELDGAQGEVDMMFDGMPYELTSAIRVGKKYRNSDDIIGFREYKQQQLRYYMAALPSLTGRLKIVELLGDRESNGNTLPSREHTWQIEMTPLELARERIVLMNRKDVLVHALRTGSLSRINQHRDIFAPALKDSRCLKNSETGYCENLETDYLQHWKDWRQNKRAVEMLGRMS